MFPFIDIMMLYMFLECLSISFYKYNVIIYVVRVLAYCIVSYFSHYNYTVHLCIHF